MRVHSRGIAFPTGWSGHQVKDIREIADDEVRRVAGAGPGRSSRGVPARVDARPPGTGDVRRGVVADAEEPVGGEAQGVTRRLEESGVGLRDAQLLGNEDGREMAGDPGVGEPPALDAGQPVCDQAQERPASELADCFRRARQEVSLPREAREIADLIRA